MAHAIRTQFAANQQKLMNELLLSRKDTAAKSISSNIEPYFVVTKLEQEENFFAETECINQVFLPSDIPTTSRNLPENKITKKYQRKYRCDQCAKVYRRKALLQEHVMDHSRANNAKKITSGKMFFCNACTEVYDNVETLKAHQNEKHQRASTFICNYVYCGKIFNFKPEYVEHMINHEKEGYCHLCTRKFADKYKLKHHYVHFHPDDTLMSDQQQNYSSKRSRSQSVTTDDSRNQFACTLCSMSYNCPQTLKRHFKNKHLMYRFTCEFCNKKFPRKERLKKHFVALHEISMEVAKEMTQNRKAVMMNDSEVY
jgi:hypothetical protein